MISMIFEDDYSYVDIPAQMAAYALYFNSNITDNEVMVKLIVTVNKRKCTIKDIMLRLNISKEVLQDTIEFINSQCESGQYVFYIDTKNISLGYVGRVFCKIITAKHKELYKNEINEYSNIIGNIKKKYDEIALDGSSLVLNSSDNITGIIESMQDISASISEKMSLSDIEGVKYTKVEDKISIEVGRASYMFLKGTVSLIWFASYEIEAFVYSKNFRAPKLYVRQHLNPKKVIPCRLYTLIKKEFKPLLEALMNRYPLFRDLIHEDIGYNIPISVEDIINADVASKYEFYIKHYKIPFDIPHSINGMTFGESYWKLKTCYKIEKNEHQKIWNLQKDEFENWNSVSDVLMTYYRTKIKKALSEDEKIIVKDWLRMYVSVYKKYTLNKTSYRKIKDEHSKIIPIYVKKTSKGKTLKISKKYDKLQLPPDFERINTYQRLAEESMIQDNCVVSYASLISKGTCCIYSLYYNSARYTVEIRHGRHGFFVKQLKACHNNNPPKNVMTYVKNALQDANRRIAAANTDSKV